MSLTIKQGDTKSGIQAVLKRNGSPVDLTGCTVRFNMAGKLVGAFVTVTSPAEGLVLCPLEASAVDTPGIYQAEFHVTYPDGRADTFPNNEYFRINIIPNIQ